jgi:hypothetical protein
MSTKPKLNKYAMTFIPNNPNKPYEIKSKICTLLEKYFPVELYSIIILYCEEGSDLKFNKNRLTFESDDVFVIDATINILNTNLYVTMDDRIITMTKESCKIINDTESYKHDGKKFIKNNDTKDIREFLILSDDHALIISYSKLPAIIQIINIKTGEQINQIKNICSELDSSLCNFGLPHTCKSDDEIFIFTCNSTSGQMIVLNRQFPYEFKRRYSIAGITVPTNINIIDKKLYILHLESNIINIYDSKNGNFIGKFKNKYLSIRDTIPIIKTTDKYIFVYEYHYERDNKHTILLLNRQNGTLVKEYVCAFDDSKIIDFYVTYDKLYAIDEQHNLHIVDRV